jgi:hypothetical protein
MKTCPGYRVSAILLPFPFTRDLLARRRVRHIKCRLSRHHIPLPGIFWHEDVSGISGVGYPATISPLPGILCHEDVSKASAVGYPVAISLYLGSFGTKTCPGYRVSAIPPPFLFTWDLLGRRRVRDTGCRLSRRSWCPVLSRPCTEGSRSPGNRTSPALFSYLTQL